MACTIKEEQGIVIIGCEGKLMGSPEDSSMVNQAEKMIQQGKTNLILDFTNVTWINSRGLGICISISNLLKENDGKLKLACLNDKVQEYFDKCRMFEVFETHPSVEDAIKSMN